LHMFFGLLPVWARYFQSRSCLSHPRRSWPEKFSADLQTLTESGWWCCNVLILKNDGVRQWEGWHPIYIYIMENTLMRQVYLRDITSVIITIVWRRVWWGARSNRHQHHALESIPNPGCNTQPHLGSMTLAKRAEPSKFHSIWQSFTCSVWCLQDSGGKVKPQHATY
jgi:hypothetical protein